jgi:plastocyanin
MTFRSASVLGAAAAAAALLAGCGGGSGSSSSGGAYGGGSAKPTATTTTATTTTASARAAAGAPLALTADESSGLAFSPKTLTAKAGTVTLKLDNPGANSLPHAISVEGQGVDQAGTIAQPGATSSVTVKLKPGVYTFYCPVGSHRAQGMEGRHTVR